MNQALVTKMAEARLSAPPELAGVVVVLDEFLKFAEEPIDNPILDSFGDALKVLTKARERVWEIQRTCEADTIARFRQRSAATLHRTDRPCAGRHARRAARCAARAA